MSPSEFYREQAEQQQRAADAAILANVRERCQRAADAFDALARRGERAALERLQIVAEKRSEGTIH